jgi:hypothetical protein
MVTTTALVSSGVSAAQLLSFRILLTAVIIALAGALIAKGEGGGHQITLARLNRQIFIPCLVFAALNRTPLHLSEAIMMSSGAVLLSLCSYPLAHWWVARAPDKDASGYLPMLFGSTSTLLLPLAYLLFGSQGLAKATFFHLANLLLLYTWGMRLTKQPTRLTEFLKTPTLHAVLLALLLKLFELDLSGQVQELLWLVEKGIGMMAAGALPMLLISHGYALFCLRSSGATWWSPVALVRMVWLPLVAFGLILTMRATGLAPLDKGYDLMQYLDLRTSEAILLLASSLPGTVSLFWMPTCATLPRRSASLILASSLLSVIALALLLFMINRFIFSA